MLDRSSAADYVYAKTSGRLAKSFVGSRANALFRAGSLAELWQLVFAREVPAAPETLLAQMLEYEAQKRFVAEYAELLSLFSNPGPVSLQLLRVYDYSNLKRINFALRTGEPELPRIVDIGRFSQLDYKAWPDMAAMTKGGPFARFKRPVPVEEAKRFEHDLDSQYVRELWGAVQRYRGADSGQIQKLVGEELALNNVSWALRLRVYYNMPAEEIIPYLVWDEKEGSAADKLGGAAVEVLEKPLDMYEAWRDWRYAALLNPHEDAVGWTLDPRWIERKARILTHKRALSMFHRFPCTPAVLVPWFKIKQYELNCICSAAEGLRLNVDEAQIKAFAGV